MLYRIAPSYPNAGVWMMNGTTLGKMRHVNQSSTAAR